jgi:hypothetical protein
MQVWDMIDIDRKQLKADAACGASPAVPGLLLLGLLLRRP